MINEIRKLIINNCITCNLRKLITATSLFIVLAYLVTIR